MGNRLVRFYILGLITASQLTFPNNTQAGFYDWLVSTDRSSEALVSTEIQTAKSNSFDKVFSWDNRVPENQSLANSILGDKSEEPQTKFKVITTKTVQASAYSSTPDQTDSTPCHTATNYNVCTGDKNVIAANFYIDGQRVPFGTLVRIPEIYGDKIFIVEDRMNARYKNNIDIWFPERSLARDFGRKQVTIEIVQES